MAGGPAALGGSGMSKTFWVGLENAETDPHGHGEDYREYVRVEDGEDETEKLQAAVLRWANVLTNLGDGDRIAIHQLKD